MQHHLNDFFAMAFGYLFGLTVLGYFCVWIWIQRLDKSTLRSTFIAISVHFILGMCALIVPALIFRQILQLQTESAKIAFALTGFTLLMITFVVARDLYRMPKEDKK